MAGTSPGSVHPPSSVHPTLQSLFERIEREAPERRDALLGFARSLTRRLSADDLGSLGTDQLYGLVRSAYAFADARGSRQLQVRVFDPTLDDDGYEATGSVVETNADDSPFLVDSVSEELAAR